MNKDSERWLTADEYLEAARVAEEEAERRRDAEELQHRRRVDALPAWAREDLQSGGWRDWTKATPAELRQERAKRDSGFRGQVVMAIVIVAVLIWAATTGEPFHWAGGRFYP